MVEQPSEEFPVVGVGASAGGLEPVRELLKNIPGNPGMAIVLIQHLDPHHVSLLSEILARETTMSVAPATEDVLAEKDHVYVIPPNVSLIISNGRLRLRPRDGSDGPFMPIDMFFRSLAQDCGRRAVGIVLSGGGTDGALGLVEIKGAGGITFVQDAQTATHDSMPRSAEGTGCADFSLPPDLIARELVRLLSIGAFTKGSVSDQAFLNDDNAALTRLFQLLRRQTGADFSQYKRPTLFRRITRRMAMSGIETLNDYVDSLPDRPDEQQALYEDILIRVTSFFRDPEAFSALRAKVFPDILRNRSAEDPVRIWVAGCATGEEVYSIAIVLMETLGDVISKIPVKILATDINEVALESARAGTYIDNIVMDVSTDRLRRFFSKMNSHYQICKSIRDLCVFSKHNLASDTPFANLDLISCRNLLIYLDSPLQKRVIPYFHYALKPGGYLMLGTSESLGASADQFHVVDKNARLFSKKTVSGRIAIELPSSDSRFSPHVTDPSKLIIEESATFSSQHEIEQVLLREKPQTAIIVDESLNILQFHGRVGKYLNPTPGAATLGVLKLFGEGFGIELHTLIDTARRENMTVRRELVKVLESQEASRIEIQVIPIHLSVTGSRVYLVSFDESHSISEPAVLGGGGGNLGTMARS